MEYEVLTELRNKDNEKLIQYLKDNEVSDEVIALVLLGIGNETKYYKILLDRLKKHKTKLTAEILKEEMLKVLDELDAKLQESMEEENN